MGLKYKDATSKSIQGDYWGEEGGEEEVTKSNCVLKYLKYFFGG